MATKVRKQIYIEPHQEALLKELAREEGVSEAEFIRQALEARLRLRDQERQRIEAWERERAFIDRLIEQGPAPGARTWKREDLYDRPKRWMG